MRHIETVAKWVLRGLEVAEEVISSVGLLVATLLIFVQVFNRYLLHFEVMWFGDLALYCATFFLLITCVSCTAKGGNIAVDYFHDRVLKEKPRASSIHRISITIVSIAAVCIFLPTAYKFMLRALKYPEYGTLVPWFNTSWLQITLYVMSVLILVHLLLIAREDTGNLRKNWRTKSQR